MQNNLANNQLVIEILNHKININESSIHSFGEGRVQVSIGAFWDLFHTMF